MTHPGQERSSSDIALGLVGFSGQSPFLLLQEVEVFFSLKGVSTTCRALRIGFSQMGELALTNG